MELKLAQLNFSILGDLISKIKISEIFFRQPRVIYSYNNYNFMNDLHLSQKTAFCLSKNEQQTQCHIISNNFS